MGRRIRIRFNVTGLQGPVGLILLAVGVAQLTTPAWALVVLGVGLLVAAAFTSTPSRGGRE